MRVLALFVPVAVALFLLRSPGGPATVVPTVAPSEGLTFAYVDVAPALGIAHRNRNAPDGNLILDSFAPGVCAADFDDDGWMDVFLPNGNRIVRYDRATRRVELLPRDDAPRHALYWNRGGRRFEEGAERAKVADVHWAFGVAAGDLDNDGRTDLYVCNWGPNQVYRNRGDRTFEEVGAESGGAGDPGAWSAGACLFDYDRDGDLDVYVAQYADVYDLLGQPGLTTIDAEGRVEGRNCDWRRVRVYCGPLGLLPLNDVLLRNLVVETGELRFEDVSAAAGIRLEVDMSSRTERSAGPFYGFQPVAWDMDGDGWQDVFVPNDSVANLCWRNRGDGTFEDQALAMGLAMSQSDWNPQACMGVAVGDLDRNGWQDLTVTNFSHDQFGLLLARPIPDKGMVAFDEKAPHTGLREMTFPELGWGALLLDPDCDRDLDLYFACGHVFPQVDEHPALETTNRQYDVLIRTLDAGRPRLEDVSTRAGPAFRVPGCSRGAAAVDFDNDGDPDVLVSTLDGPPRLLRCDLDRTQRPAHWLAVRLRGNPSARVPRDPAGSVVAVHAGGVVQTRVLLLGSSFLSSEDPRLHFGLGDAEEAERVEVLWTNGTRTRLDRVAADRVLEIACAGE